MATRPRHAARPTSRRRSRPAAKPAPKLLTIDERRSLGRQLREQAPRESHSAWKPAPGRADPVALLEASNAGRITTLVPMRFGRMSTSPFAFYRGAAALMASDLSTTPVSGITVQACGDAHLMNFGGFATPERNVVFDINDLDETLPAPWEWDLKRLAASVVIAAQHIGLADSDAARAARDTARAYRERMADYSSMRTLDVWYDKIDVQRYEDRAANPKLIAKVRKRMARNMREAQRKSVPEHLFPKLVELKGEQHRIKDEPPLIFHADEKVAPGVRDNFASALAAYRESLPEHVRVLYDRYQFCDMAVKVVGVGSVGTMCAVGLFMANEQDPLFLQFKEARASVLEPYAGAGLHANHGQRVVVGQRLMQSASDVFLGWTEGRAGRHFYVRQLRDLKMSAVIENWDPRLLRQYGRMCAHALARAHARSGDAARISGYMGSGRTFDDAIADFAVAYSDQNAADYRAFLKAIRQGRVPAQREEA